jgi:hypothetical protein
MNGISDDQGDWAGAGERRNFLRATVLWTGHLECDGQVADCILLNVGVTGAMVRMAVPFERGFPVTLYSYHFGELIGRVIWQDGNAIGLSFEDEPERVIETLGRALPELLAA